MTPLRRTVVASLAALLVLALVAAPASAAAQRWYPNETDGLYLSPEEAAQSNPGGEPGFAVVTEGNTQTWRADQPALVHVDFGDAPWRYHLTLGDWFVGHFIVYVGTYDAATGVFDVHGERTVWSDGSGVLEYEGEVPLDRALVVPEGQYLGFRIFNEQDPSGEPDAKKKLVIAAGVAGTFFESPASDPGYPLPELGTLVLALAGLALVGVLASRRRA